MAKTVGMGAKQPETAENKEIAKLKKENAALKKELAALKKEQEAQEKEQEQQERGKTHDLCGFFVLSGYLLRRNGGGGL